jgi:Txe/YoeB family toxin of toxin-antitoxin system
MYKIEFTKNAEKDSVKIERAGLKDKTAEIIRTVRKDPFEPSQSFEKLKGNLKDMYSRRINRHHRFIYSVFPNAENLKDEKGELYEGIVHVNRMWTHYE